MEDSLLLSIRRPELWFPTAAQHCCQSGRFLKFGALMEERRIRLLRWLQQLVICMLTLSCLHAVEADITRASHQHSHWH